MKKKAQIRRTDLLQLLGQRLRDVRTQAGLSQEELALKAGISQSQIYRIEKGLINTTISTVLHIAETLEVPYSMLFEFERDS